jgi:chromosomal replication initiation ATPase DnaA
MYTELEQSINKVLQKVGTRSLIRYLNNFERNFNYRADTLFQIIEGIVCQYFEISAKKLYEDITSINAANARRTMVFLLKEKTMFTDKEIRDQLSISRQSYSSYVNNIKNVLDNKAADLKLYEAIQETNEMFEIKNDNKWKIRKKQK